MTPIELAGWLSQVGLRNGALEELVDGFGSRLNEAGLQVERMFLGMNTLHPMVRARSLIWDAGEGVGQHFEFAPFRDRFDGNPEQPVCGDAARRDCRAALSFRHE